MTDRVRVKPEALAARRAVQKLSAEGVSVPWLEMCARDILMAIGEDPDREGLRDTPRRFAQWWHEFIDYDPGNCETTFQVQNADQMIVVSGLRVYSLCEHHLLPFWCDVAIGYLAQEQVLGLSKFGRIAQAAAHKLQIQERLVREIADTVSALVESPDVAVIASGEHLCMTSRGIRMPQRFVSSVMLGVFRESPQARAEFLTLAGFPTCARS